MYSSFNDIPFLRLLPLVVAVALAGALVGCDSVEVRTDAADEVPSDGPSEVEIQSDTFTRADIQFDPVSIAPGQTFSIELTDKDLGRNATRIVHEGTEEGRHLLRAQFDPLQPASVTVQCRNENTGAEQKVAEMAPGSSKSTTDDWQKIGSSSDEPTSYHYVNDGDNIIVEVDYNNRQAASVAPDGAFSFPSVDQPLECTHVSFVMEEVSTRLTADGIQFRGGSEELTFRQKELR